MPASVASSRTSASQPIHVNTILDTRPSHTSSPCFFSPWTFRVDPRPVLSYRTAAATLFLGIGQAPQNYPLPSTAMSH